VGLTDSLVAHLDSLPEVSRVRQVKLDYAWELTTRLNGGKPPSDDRADWDRRAHWGAQADLTILDWLECRHEEMEEIVRLLDWDVPGIHLIGELAKTNPGVMIASAHLGPLYTGPVFLHAADIPFKVVASTPRVSQARYVPSLISTLDQSELAVARQVMTAVKGGHGVIISIDGSVDPSAKRYMWEGTPITCSKFIPELVYRGIAPAVYAQPYWDIEGGEGRIGVHVRRMPDPEEGETEEAFVTRWMEAYYDELRAFVLRGPENLRLAGGIWRNVSNTEELGA
jgi:lauroyl/myristoyl acyltransferase